MAKSAKNVYPFEVEVDATPSKQQAVDDLVRKLFGEPFDSAVFDSSTF